MPHLRLLLPVLLLAYAGCTSAQSVSAAAPLNWTTWADVEVSWTHPSPLPSDWVGAFLPAWNATYIQWWPVTASPSWPSNSGSLRFRLLNGRHPFVFRYFRGDDVLAESNEVQPLGATPLQGHLSMSPGFHDRMIVSWVSNSTTGDALVMWGVTADALNETAPATHDTYTADDFTNCMGIPPIKTLDSPFPHLSSHDLRCGASCYDDPTSSQLYLDPGFLHNAVLQPLQPARRYYYRFGSSYGGWSEVYSFIAPRVAGDTTPFTFLYTADAGIGNPPKEEQGGACHNDLPINGADGVFAAMIRDPATAKDEMMIVNGDISYARGWPWIWERYFDLIQPLATMMPWMVGVGNHEIDTHENKFHSADGNDSGGECGVATFKRFPQFASLSDMWYSFSYGLVHIIMLSSEHPQGPQVEFFLKDMAAVQRSVTPWVIVQLHRPPFTSCPRDALDVELALTWHKLFVLWEVDFVMTGHVHFYERLCAVQDMYSCSLFRDRPIYVADGSAGAEFDPHATPPSNLTMHKEFNYWGYSRFAVTADSLTFTHYHTDNIESDKVMLPRKK